MKMTHSKSIALALTAVLSLGAAHAGGPKTGSMGGQVWPGNSVPGAQMQTQTQARHQTRTQTRSHNDGNGQLQLFRDQARVQNNFEVQVRMGGTTGNRN